MKTNKYLNNFYCPNHTNQKLSLVCVQPTCSNRGLICSFCRNQLNDSNVPVHKQHQHQIVPFKILIESLQANFDHKSIDDKYESKGLGKLQEIRNQMLYRLKLSVEKMAQVMEKIQLNIMDEYEKSKDDFLLRKTVVGPFRKIVERTLVHDIRKQQKYQLINAIKEMIPLIGVNTFNTNNHKYQLKIQQNNILSQFHILKEQVTKKCNMINNFSETLNQFKKHIYQENIAAQKAQENTIKNKFNKNQYKQPYKSNIPVNKDSSLNVSITETLKNYYDSKNQKISKSYEFAAIKKPIITSNQTQKTKKQSTNNIFPFHPNFVNAPKPIFSKQSTALNQASPFVNQQPPNIQNLQQTFLNVNANITKKNNSNVKQQMLKNISVSTVNQKQLTNIFTNVPLPPKFFANTSGVNINSSIQTTANVESKQTNAGKQGEMKLSTKKQDILIKKMKQSSDNMGKHPYANKVGLQVKNSQQIIKPKKMYSFADFELNQSSSSSMSQQNQNVTKSKIFTTLQDKQKLKTTQNQIIFSSLVKSLTVKILKGSKMAKQSAGPNTSTGGFVLVSESIEKCKTISFKIIKLNFQICVGIGLRNIIGNNKFLFQKNIIGHGAFLINDSGYIFSHSDEKENNVYKDLQFQEGDIINLKYQNGILHFNKVITKKGQANQKNSTALSLMLTPAQLKVAYFCVCVNGKDDSVRIA